MTPRILLPSPRPSGSDGVRRPGSGPRRRGFTILEILVGLGIGTLVLGVAWTLFRQVRLQTRKAQGLDATTRAAAQFLHALEEDMAHIVPIPGLVSVRNGFDPRTQTPADDNGTRVVAFSRETPEAAPGVVIYSARRVGGDAFELMRVWTGPGGSPRMTFGHFRARDVRFHRLETDEGSWLRVTLLTHRGATTPAVARAGDPPEFPLSVLYPVPTL